MRLTRLLLLSVAALGAAACTEDDGVTVNDRPPLGGVRFINAVPDGGPVDIRMVDQTEWSASSVSGPNTTGLPFRFGTIHWATEAKARHIRVFPTSSDIAVTSQVLHDTTITIEANRNVTLMLVGSQAEGGQVSFIMIDDTPPSLTDGQIGVRVVNAGAAASVDGYMTATDSTPLPASPTWAGVAENSAGAYVTPGVGEFAVQATATGAPATIWSAVAPEGEPMDGLISAEAGFSATGSVLAAYAFSRACPAVATPLTVDNCPTLVGQGSTARAALQAPAVIYFVDRIPGAATMTGSNP